MIALSWSRLNNYLLCPRKFNEQYVEKTYPDDSNNPNFKRGNRLHKQMEDYIVYKNGKGELKNMSPETQSCTGIIDNVFKNYDKVYSELQLATNQDWKECSWFSKPTTVKYRCIIDCLALREGEALAIDFKTGKVRPYEDNHGQLHLTAAMIMHLYPQVNKVTLAYLFLDHKQTVDCIVWRKELEEQTSYFDDMHGEVNACEDFKPRKHEYCGFCLIKNDCPVYKR